MKNKCDINYINSKSGTKRLKSELTKNEERALNKLKEQFHRCDDNRKFVVQLDIREKNWLNAQIIMVFTSLLALGTTLEIIKAFTKDALLIGLWLMNILLIIGFILGIVYYKYDKNKRILDKQMQGYTFALQKTAQKWLEIEYEDVKQPINKCEVKNE